MAFVYCAIIKYPGTVLCEFQQSDFSSVSSLSHKKSKEIYKEKQEIIINNEFTLFSLMYAQDNNAQFICVGKTKEVYSDKAYTLLTKIRKDFFDEYYKGNSESFDNCKVTSMCYQEGVRASKQRRDAS